MPLSRTAVTQPFPSGDFEDVLAANADYVRDHVDAGLSGWARQGLAKPHACA